MSTDLLLEEAPGLVVGVQSSHHKTGDLKRVTVVSNNSCLFASFLFLLHRKECSDSVASVPVALIHQSSAVSLEANKPLSYAISVNSIRGLAARSIQADPDTFNELTLEKPVEEYLNWIKQPCSWGGYIELIALSRAYNIHIVVIDFNSNRKDEYGDLNCGKTILLMYDGSHYDPIVAEDICHKGRFVPIFSENIAYYTAKAMELVRELKSNAKPLLLPEGFRCLDCKSIFPDRDHIAKHASSTGHQRYSEVKKD